MPQAWKIAELSLRELLSFNRSIKQDQCPNKISIAISGDCATQHYTQCLSAAMKIRGFWPHIHEFEFDSFNQELLDPQSRFNTDTFDVIVLFNCVQALQERFHHLDQSQTFIQSIIEEFTERWTLIRSKSNALILQHNLCLPLDFTFGNFSHSFENSFLSSVSAINRSILANASKVKNVHILDTDAQAAFYGKNTWLDEGLWCQAKQALSPHFLPPLVKTVSDAIAEKRGFTVKCVILDLDNTLWGGILGDVGINEIEIGDINEIGRSYSRFQHSIKLLKARGILLTVCSKNNPETAKEVFQKHPDMVLNEDDIVCFVANYEDKVKNILQIQQELNIGLNSMVFLDDSPFERNYVRESLPDIQVPDLPDDPTQYAKCLSKLNLFASSMFSSEDAERTRLYKDDISRDSLKRNFSDLTSYLESLEMVAEIEPFDEYTLPRVEQLIQRSNQFNLTTHRHNQATLKSFASQPEKFITFCVRLKDRIGDNGIVSLMIGRIQDTEIEIDTWIMSCRVLGRKIEHLTLSCLLKKAKQLGINRIIGIYKKTDKNGMVSNLYSDFGFTKDRTDDTMSRYSLDLSDCSDLHIDHIKIVERNKS